MKGRCCLGKINKHYYLKESTVQKIKEYEEKNHLKQGEALDQIVEKFFEKDSKLAKEISDTVIADLSKVLTRVRLGVNNADRNSQILIELMNTQVIHQNINRALPTSDYKNKSNALLEAEMTVKTKLEGFRNKKLSTSGVE